MARVLTITGDGVGQEVIPAAQRILEALDLPLEFEEGHAGFGVFEQIGTALPPDTLEACERSDAILFGATQSPMDKVTGYYSPVLALRQHFDLFANLRPIIGLGRPVGMLDEGKGSIPIDMLIVRENTEGLYCGHERVEDNGQKAIAERVITAEASRRVVDLAAREALARPRKKLTLVHKANVLKETCGLFRRVGWDVANTYSELTVDEVLVDACAMHMVQNPERFDVIVTTNLFGDILSDLGAGLVGGLGLAPSANIGVARPALFEPVHGSAPDIAGKGIADPRAAILSAALMLDYLGYRDRGDRLRLACGSVTRHISTQATTDAVLAFLENGTHE